MSIKLSMGFEYNYDNLMGEGRVTKEDVEEIKDKIEAAAKAIEVMRETGDVKGHLSKDGAPEKVYFTELPYIKYGGINSPASLAKLHEFASGIHGYTDIVVSLGIGGSYLGNKVLFDITCGEYWNLTPTMRMGWPEIYFSGQNMDALSNIELLRYLHQRSVICDQDKGRKLRVLLLLISKSGSTIDTISNFLVLKERLDKEELIDVEVVAVTDPAILNPTLLKKLAKEQGWKTFAIPDGVGGRFSVFSEVGLSLASCFDFKTEKFLTGARLMDEACQSADVWENPALLNAALKYIAAKKYGRNIEVLMPYSNHLKSLAEWYVQLLAESLGKEKNRAGEIVHYGRTPIVAVGTTDMHAQTQQHQEGALDKVVQFIRIENWKSDCEIPSLYPEVPQLEALAGIKMSEALEIARVSNEEALASNGRFTALYSLAELSPYHVGALMYFLALTVAYEGEIADVDAFDQPGVEAYKRIMMPRLQAMKK